MKQPHHVLTVVHIGVGRDADGQREPGFPQRADGAIDLREDAPAGDAGVGRLAGAVERDLNSGRRMRPEEGDPLGIQQHAVGEKRGLDALFL